MLVEIPISPPKPNSPPSANWVETLCIAIELFTPFKKTSAFFLLLVIILSVCIVPYFKICSTAPFTFLTVLTEIIASRYSVFQSFSVAFFNFPLKILLIFLSALTSQPESKRAFIISLACEPKAFSSIRRVSTAPQILVLLIFALIIKSFAILIFAVLST